MQKNGIPFETDSDKLLDILTVFGILSNAYSMFLSKDTRPRRDAIEKNLLEEGTNMLKLLQSIEGDAPLIHYLIEKTNEIVSSIRSTLHHVDTVLGTISKPLLLGSVVLLSFIALRCYHFFQARKRRQHNHQLKEPACHYNRRRTTNDAASEYWFFSNIVFIIIIGFY